MLNKVILIGNVGSDPDIRTMPNGGKVANFSLATSEYWTDKNGERQSRTEWHRIVIYVEGLVKVVEKVIHKGSKLYVEGSIKSRKYKNQQGAEVEITEIVLDSFASMLKVLNKKEAEPQQEQQAVIDDKVDDDIPF